MPTLGVGARGPKGIQGPKGDTGDQGPQGQPGVIAAEAPLIYDDLTQVISINVSGFVLTTTDQVINGKKTFPDIIEATTPSMATRPAIILKPEASAISGYILEVRDENNVFQAGIEYTYALICRGVRIDPQASAAVNIGRRGSGNGNGQFWGFSVSNAGATDAMLFGMSSSTYTTGGGIGWLGNSTCFIYIPAVNRFKIGSGLGTSPRLEIGTNDISFWLTTEWRAKSSTSTDRAQGSIVGSWVDNTDASRKGRLTLNTVGTSVREGLHIETDNTYAYASISAPNTTPSDSILNNGQICPYLDQTDNNLYFKVKYSNGTIKTAGPFPLT